MSDVGIRDLKARLSHHLKRVRAGARLTVTDRGRAIATIHPVNESVEPEWALEMVARGEATWAGGKPSGARHRARLKGGRLVSEAVLEDRE